MTSRLPKRILYSLCGLFFIIIFFIFIYRGKNEATLIRPEIGPEQLTDYYIDDVYYSASELPVRLATKAGEPIHISGLLPDNLRDGDGICFLSIYSSCELFVEDEPVGSYGTVLPLSFGHMVGNIRVIIPLDNTMAGKTFTLVITPYFSVSNADLSGVTLGPVGELKLDILLHNIPKLIIILVLFTLALITLILVFNQAFEKSGVNLRLYGCFCLMDTFVFLWLLCSSDLPQFFTDSNELVSFISFLCLSCMALPYMGFCEQIFPRYKKYFLTVQTVGGIIPLINLVCFIFNVCDPMDLLIATHVYMLIAILSSVMVALLNPKKNHETWLIVAGVGLLAISGLGGLFCYFISPSSGFDGLFFGIGFICFIVALFLLILVRQVALIKERQHLETYKVLAYNDIMTELGNRSAFENHFATMHERLRPGEPVTLFIFDLNGLKRTNDTFGHQAGDDMIRRMGEQLDKVFVRHGNCYRLGGDEFAVIIERSMLDLRELRSSFEDALNNTTLYSGEKLSSSLGYATLPFSTSPDFRNELFERADAAMYKDKKRYHEFT